MSLDIQNKVKMYSIRYIDPEISLTVNDIAIYNLTLADKHFNLSLFIAAANGWLNTNPGKNFQDLEKELRELKLNTHLYARAPKLKENMVLSINNTVNSNDYIYECIFSCRPAYHALNEVLKYWPSYEDNFKALSKAGMIMIKNDKNINNDMESENEDKVINFNEDEVNFMNLISTNKKKLIFEPISSEEMLNKINNDIVKIYGKNPEYVLFGMSYDGGPILAMSIEGKIVSQYGINITYTADGKKIIKIIDITKM